MFKYFGNHLFGLIFIQAKNLFDLNYLKFENLHVQIQIRFEI